MDVLGDSGVTGGLNLGSPVNGAVQVLEGAISIDVGEEVRWFDRVSRAGLSEAVRGGDCKPFYEMMPGESKATITYDHE